jgi:hypothetical protein
LFELARDWVKWEWNTPVPVCKRYKQWAKLFQPRVGGRRNLSYGSATDLHIFQKIDRLEIAIVERNLSINSSKLPTIYILPSSAQASTQA